MAERCEFLLEIGCEEIPASWLPGLTAQAGELLARLAGEAALEPTGLETHSTPRRLVLRADLLQRQADREEQVFGPALKAARDAAGQWTKAAEGFAKKCGVALDALQQAPKDPKKPDELNLLFVKRTAGAPASEVLPGVLAALLRGLSFPKRMSWDAWLDENGIPFESLRPW